MPEICRFYGIIIRMYYDDHNPPRFHALYGDDEVWVNYQHTGGVSWQTPPTGIRLDDRMGVHASG